MIWHQAVRKNCEVQLPRRDPELRDDAGHDERIAKDFTSFERAERQKVLMRSDVWEAVNPGRP
jgi:hypothetical protein